ncbi:hypothetical protein [Variovorax sp. PvP013]
MQVLAALLAGHSMHFSPELWDKMTQADPLSSQINASNVVMVRGS